MIHQTLAGLIQKALDTHLIEGADTDYVRNQVMSLLGLASFPEEEIKPADDTIPNLLENMVAYAVEQGIIEDIFDDKEMLSATIMNCFVARPSVINAVFNEKYVESPVAATDYFYELSKNSNFPHPEGPTSTRNSLSRISRLKSCTDTTPFSYSFLIFTKFKPAI